MLQPTSPYRHIDDRPSSTRPESIKIVPNPGIACNGLLPSGLASGQLESVLAMHDLNDTILAIATPVGGARTIVRITGPKTLEACRSVVRQASWPAGRGTYNVDLAIGPGLVIEGRLYFFPAPHSYTGQTVVEIHVEAGLPVAEALVRRLLEAGARQAGPGEFTARAYLHGKMDLTQAEAVNEVISSTNHIQCRAAERLLQGRLSSTLAGIRSQILEVLSLLEAGLDFAEEEGTQGLSHQTMEGLSRVHASLKGLQSDTLHVDSVAHLPSVGLAGVPNAGKSTLFNALVGKARSIVSVSPRTTRDVLEAVLDLRYGRTVLFDCAGLLRRNEEILDQLAQQAAVQSLRRANLVVFCVDVSKAKWQDDLTIRRHVTPESVVYVATKADLVGPFDLDGCLDNLGRTFGQAFLPVSAKTGMNLDTLRDAIQRHLLSGSPRQALSDSGPIYVTLTARLRQAIVEAVDHLNQAVDALKQGQDEVAAMMLRAAYQALSDTGRPVDDEVLDTLFSRFCIGK